MKLGVIGLGIMGSSIARNSAQAGAEVAGFDIDAGRRKELEANGGKPKSSAVEVASASDVVLTSLPSVAALDATCRAIAESAKRGLVVAEHSTLPIADKERNRDLLANVGIELLDCPLSGTGAQAATRDLVVYASGSAAGYERAKPAFPLYARLDYYLGAFGNGSKMKFVANLLVAIHNVASAEAMVLGIKSGLDPALIERVIKTGAGNSRVFELRAPLMAANDYEPPSMKIDVWKKDMEIIGTYARSLGAATPLFDATAPLYLRAIEEGLGGKDTAAVCAVLERMSGVKRA
jgi:3-hydroxyisobutyrate dehydrogenase-like beta-hydroxyacid dehydrogenase